MLARDIERAAESEAEERARAGARHGDPAARVRADQRERSCRVVHAAVSDDMKGRIIGREGRNIRSFEQVTGVNLVIDDTPEAVVLSCFDPVRREVARLTLEELVADGRIHPSRIEEVHERSVLGGRAALRAGRRGRRLRDGHHRPAPAAGRDAGPAALPHVVRPERAQAPRRVRARSPGMLADELGLDRADLRARRVPARHRQGADPRGRGLPRDGRRRPGPHATASTRTSCTRSRRTTTRSSRGPSRRCSPRPRTRSAAAGRVRGGSPSRRTSSGCTGSRRSPSRKPGVEKVFAMQAGRDVRVMVAPEQVDDIGAQVLARDIAKQFEEELTYPGQIKVTVIRESRATEMARQPMGARPTGLGPAALRRRRGRRAGRARPGWCRRSSQIASADSSSCSSPCRWPRRGTAVGMMLKNPL